MRKIVVPNSFLAEAAETLRNGKPVKLRIDGQSMFPFIKGGVDLVEVVPFMPQDELPELCCPFYLWEDRYMIHRYIGRDGDDYLMLGDGNLARIERVKRSEIFGLLKTIYYPNGSEQDCSDPHWLNCARWWVRLRPLRRFLLPIIKRVYRTK